MEEDIVVLLTNMKNLLEDIKREVSELNELKSSVVKIDDCECDVMTEPLPCNLCGSDNVEVGKNNSFGCYVRCNDCFESVQNMQTREEAIKMWNRRAM